MNKFQDLYGNYLIRPANSVMHDPYRQFIIKNKLFDKVITNQNKVDVQTEFLDYYPEYIKSSKLNSFTGLDKFEHRYVSLGVSQGIDDFTLYCLKNNKRIRFCQGEYGYGREISVDPKYAPIEHEPLTVNDALIISCPFSATGDKHVNWDDIIETCNKLNIPVFVDCAFFGTCININVDFNQPCIDTVAFSPTKGLNTGNMRTGIVFTNRHNNDSSLHILTEWHHGIHLNTYLAYNLMLNFNPDTIANTYRDIQLTVCEHYQLMPTNTIHLALGDNNWDYFTRDSLCNRICLRNPIYDYYNTGTVK